MRVCWLVLILFLSACQVQPVVEGERDDDDWSLTGKLGVVAGTERGNFSVNWRQQQDSFEINLLGPLGLGIARVNGDANGVVLSQPGKSPVTAATPDELLLSTLGLDIPVTPMKQWVRGRPARGRYRNTNDGFVQFGWTVQYLEFKNSLPTRMRVSRPEVRLTMVVRQWTN